MDTLLDQPLHQFKRKRPMRRRFRLSSIWSGNFIVGTVVVIDFVNVVLAGIASHTLFASPTGGPFRNHLVASIICAVAVVHFNFQFKLYNLAHSKSPALMIERVFFSVVAAFTFLIAGAYLTDTTFIHPSTWKVSIFLLTFIFVSSGRLAFSAAVARLSELKLLSRNIVIVGAGERCEILVEHLKRSGCPWTRVLCIFDDRARNPLLRTPKRVSMYPVLGTTQDLISFSRRMRVDEIFIALPWTAESRINDILNALRAVPANIHLCPDLSNSAFTNSKVSALDGVPVLTMVGKPMTGWSYLAKWFLDKLLALAGLIVLLPLLIGVVIAIKLDSRGPVLFRQQRLGFNNRLIEVYKFRSMYHDQRDAGADRLATRDDPRITRVGRILRRTSIDELPQLFNVLFGDMALVGPRPHALKAKAAGLLYQEVVDEYALRHKIKPGITGWAQINGWRGETDTEEKIIKRVEHDLYYISNWSILFDLYIIVMTVLKVPFHKNAY